MNKKLQVFISSTYTDLIEERQAAVEAILDAGHIPAGMELFKAGKSQMRTIQKWIDESDIYMLILGGRYGTVDEESGLSYTELEYNYALSKNTPVFAIVLDDTFLFTKAASMGGDAIFEKKYIEKYVAFKEFVKTKIVKFVSNIEQISTTIHSNLKSISEDEEYSLTGWVRENDIQNNIEHELYNKKIGKYTYYELVNALSNKKIDSVVNEDMTALNFFIAYYPKFYEGFYIDNTLNKGILARLYSIGENYIFNNICPYFMAFDLLKYENSQYVISENGLYFYSLLTMEYDI